MQKIINNIYIHIPFCSSRCSYCNFCTYVSKNWKLHEDYIKSLLNEIEIRLAGNIKLWELNSIYFWWWTPSLIESGLIWKIICKFKNFIKNKTEILIECNPQDISENKLKSWKQVWINRISIWIQTFQECFFWFLGRNVLLNKFNKDLEIFWQSVSSKTIKTSLNLDTNNNLSLKNKINLAQKHFSNLSIDMIFWFPWQTLQDVKNDLKIIKELNLNHISWYALDYKKDSKIENKKDYALSFDKIIKYYDFICTEIEKQWFVQYEIYNWAKYLNEKKWIEKLNKNIHNYDFWQWKDYTWFWLSAVSCIWKTVTQNTNNLKKYITDFQSFQEVQNLSEFEQEYFLLQRIFRLTCWIKISKIKEITNKQTFEKIMKSEFIEIDKRALVSLNQRWKMYFSDFFEEEILNFL